MQLVLQRIHELQKQAAVAGNAFSFFYAAGELNAAVVGFAESDLAAGKLGSAGLHVDERLVFGIAENGVIRNSKDVLQGGGADRRGHVHILFQFFTGILGDDAGLQGAGGSVESRSDVGNFSMKLFRVRVGGNFHFLTLANISQIGLVDVDQNPDGAGVGNGEALGGSGLQELAGTDEAFDNFAGNRSNDRDFRGGLSGIFGDGFGIFQAKRAKRIRRRFQIGVSLVAGGFGLLQVGFSDGAVGVKILGASVELVGEGVGISGFKKGAARDGIVRAGYGEQRLALVNELAGSNQNFVNRPTDGGEHRGSKKGVVGHRASEAKCARQIFFLYRHDLDVAQLFLGDLKRLRGISFLLAVGVGGHFGFSSAGTGAATGERDGEEAGEASETNFAILGH